MTTHTTYSSLIKQKQIDEHVNTIGKWIYDVDGDDALEFIYKYIHHLNDNTKGSMYHHLLEITGVNLIEMNKKNDLMLLINELVRLI